MDLVTVGRHRLNARRTLVWHLLRGRPVHALAIDAGQVDGLFQAMYATPGYQLTVDLEQQLVRTPDGEDISFDVDAFRKHCLLNGLDDIGLTLQSADAIRSYEQRWREQSPWLFDVIN